MKRSRQRRGRSPASTCRVPSRFPCRRGAQPWLPVLAQATEARGPSRFPPSPAAVRRAEREAAHQATLGPLQEIRVLGASGNNLQNVNVAFPVGLFTCVTGVSGSGKSTLVNDTLYAAVARTLYRAHEEPAPHEAIEGIEHFDKVINVDQSPIGRTPRSNPATYTGLFTPIRELMAEVPMAKERGYGPGRFSFNVAGGRCEACEGDGVVKVEMHFLPDVYVPCDVCHGQRYNRETLEVQWKGRNIAQILDMTVEDAHLFLKPVPTIARKLQTLLDVGLSYVKLGQAATTLSGGEAQRVKLALELSKRDTGRTLYILDEPTTGLHFADIALLLKVLHQLRDAGNTIVVIEHNLDVIKTADWIIDMGPEGGAGGGLVVGVGTPEEIAANPASHTGHLPEAAAVSSHGSPLGPRPRRRAGHRLHLGHELRGDEVRAARLHAVPAGRRALRLRGPAPGPVREAAPVALEMGAALRPVPGRGAVRFPVHRAAGSG